MFYSMEKFTITFIFLMAYILKTQQQNLFCNSDFQTYQLSAPFLNNGFMIKNNYFPKDECWYTYGAPQIQIQQPMYAPYTQMAQLNGLTQPETLCQNVSLSMYQLYKFTFQFGLHPQINSTTVSAYINSYPVISISHDYTIFPNLVTVTYIFQPDTYTTQFCVDSYQTWKVPNYTTSAATLVDNFQLTLIPKIAISVIFKTLLYEQISTLIFNTTDTFSSQFIQHILGNTVLLNQYGNIITCLFAYDANGYIATSLVMTESVNVSVFGCDTAGYTRIGDQLYNFECQVQPTRQKQLFIPMSDSYVRAIQDIQKLGHSVTQNIFNVYNLVRLIGCSYFFINFITFYCLLVLYNFLNLSMQPEFSYNIMKQLASYFLKSDDNIFSMIKSLLSKFRVQSSYNFDTFVNNNGYYQRVASLKNDFSWFKQFGITYNFLQNNFADLCILILILIKLFLIYKISHYFINRKQCSSLSKKQNYFQIFIIQGLCSAPVMIISALSLFLSSGTYLFAQKINYIFHITLFGLTISLPFLYTLLIYKKYISQINKLKKQKSVQSIKNTQNTQKIQHIHILKSKFYWGQCCTCLQYALYILIPCLAAINNQLSFLIFTSLYLLIFSISFIKGYPYMSTYKKIYNTFIIVIFTIHHICFIYIFALSTLRTNGRYINEQNVYDVMYYCKVASVVVILMVICGGFIQIVDCVVQFVKNVLMPSYQKLKGIIMLQWNKYKQNQRGREKNAINKQQLKQQNFIAIDPTSTNQNNIPISIYQKQNKQDEQKQEASQDKQIQYIPVIELRQEQIKQQTIKSHHTLNIQNDDANQIISYFERTHKIIQQNQEICIEEN